MKVFGTRTDFTGDINPGRFAFIIELDNNDGFDMDINDLYSQAIHFFRIVLKGDEVFYQKEEVAKFIKKINTNNPNSFFEIYTYGKVRPVGIGNYSNIQYNVNVRLSNSGLDINERYDTSALKWFSQINANFLFTITNQDDFDEAELLIHDYGVKKSNVFFTPGRGNKEMKLKILLMIIKNLKIKGYNFFINLFNIDWNDFLEEQNDL